MSHAENVCDRINKKNGAAVGDHDHQRYTGGGRNQSIGSNEGVFTETRAPSGVGGINDGTSSPMGLVAKNHGIKVNAEGRGHHFSILDDGIINVSYVESQV
jgi:hypothetical protein